MPSLCKFSQDLTRNGQEIARCPYSENWISFAAANKIAFEKDLAYFGDNGKPVFMPKPDMPATSVSTLTCL